jgi:hypothetical protein
MSAFGGKADMTFCGANAAYDPKRTCREFKMVVLTEARTAWCSFLKVIAKQSLFLGLDF